MDPQQIMELLLKEMKAMQEKEEADRKAAQEEFLTRWDADTKAWREKLDEETRATLAETRAIEARTAAMREKKLKANMNAWQEETTACQDAMETNPRDKWVDENHNETLAMQVTETSRKETAAAFEPETEVKTMACQEMEARQEEEERTSPDRKPEGAQKAEVPAQKATVMPVGEPKKKRRRDRKLAAEHRRQKPKASKLENCGPQKRLDFTYRGRTCRAKMARKTQIDRKMSRRSTVARHIETSSGRTRPAMQKWHCEKESPERTGS
jgi:hypothetical protein